MNCKTCKYFDGKYCDELNDEDEQDKKYAHNNHPMMGLEINVSDDTGLDIRTRVNENFGCVLHKPKELK